MIKTDPHKGTHLTSATSYLMQFRSFTALCRSSSRAAALLSASCMRCNKACSSPAFIITSSSLSVMVGAAADARDISGTSPAEQSLDSMSESSQHGRYSKNKQINKHKDDSLLIQYLKSVNTEDIIKTNKQLSQGQ